MPIFKHVWHDHRTLRSVHLAIEYEIVNGEAVNMNVHTDVSFFYADDVAMTRAIAGLTDGEPYMDLHAAAIQPSKVLPADVAGEITRQFLQSLVGASLRELCCRDWRDKKHEEAAE